MFQLTVEDKENNFHSDTTTVMVVKPQVALLKPGPRERGIKPMDLQKVNLQNEEERKRKLREKTAQSKLKEARAQDKSGDRVQAISLAEKSLMLNPASGDTIEFIDKLDRTSQRQGDALWKKAEKEFTDKNYLKALSLFQKSARAYPYNSAAGEMVQICILALEKMAFHHYEGLISSPGDNKTSRINMGRSLEFYREGLLSYSQGRLREAADYWEKAVTLNVNNKLAQNALSRVKLEIKEN